MPIERSNAFHLLLSDDELRLLTLLAERDGLERAEYLRALIRAMPSTLAPSVGQVMRLGAVLGSSLGEGGRGAFLERLFDARRDGMKKAQALDETRKKKAK